MQVLKGWAYECEGAVVVAAAAAAVDLGFTTLLRSQVIRVAFYSEREKYDKFCSEALISASDSFWRAVNLRYGTHDFTSLPKEVTLTIFRL